MTNNYETGKQAENGAVEYDATGLTALVTPRPKTLGKRGARITFDASKAGKVTDPGSGLELFNLRDVFTRPAAVIGIGVPNSYLLFPDEAGEGWDKLNAFMFYRQKSYVARTKDRVQAGVLFEMPDLTPEATQGVAEAARRIAGRRSISCAHEVAYALAEAGFSSPGGSLQMIVRPSELAWLLWEHGLHYQGRPVRLRVITTSTAPNKHFLSVWRKEVSAPARLITKLLHRGHSLAAPVVPPGSVPAASSSPVGGVITTLGIARPSSAGAKLGLVLGEQPIYSVEIPAAQRETLSLPELAAPLGAYPGRLDTVTKLKRYVLFSKLSVRSIRAMLDAELETYPGTPAGVIPPMLRLSDRERSKAYRYNYVLTGTHIRVKRLESGAENENKAAAWILAKHVLLSGYSKDVRLAGEIWTYRRENGEQVLVVNANSGTYKPGPERVSPAAGLVEEIFGLPVEIDATWVEK